MALLTNINGKFSVSDAGAVTFNNAFTFPTTDGTANYVLKTNGSGQLAWAADNYENYDYWTLQGDSAANVNINSTNTLKFIGGTYIDTSATWAGGSNPRKLTINHETTSRTDTTSTDAPAFGGTFEAVTSVTTNTTGHVTAIDVSTITIPTDPGGTVTGTGVANKVAYWTSATNIDDGPITFATNDSTFAGSVTIAGNLFLPTASSYIKLGGYSYIGEDLTEQDSLTIASDSTESIYFAHYNQNTSVYTTTVQIDPSGNMMLDVNNWLQGHVTVGGGTQNLIRSRAMGYPGYYGCQIGQETNHIALFIDPNSVAGGAFSGNVNELMLPNKVIFQQANAVTNPTDWLNGQSITLDNGKVGIGTTGPTEKLDVSGTAIVRSTLFTVGNVHGFTSTYGASFFINNGGGNTYFNATGGNVGIGTTSPAAKLFVDGKDTSNNSSLMTRLDTTYAMGISNEWVSTYVSKLQLGRVGIGNTSNIDFIYDISGTEYGSIKRNYTASSLKFERGTTVDMIINGSGNVGIGKTPQSDARLHTYRNSTNAYNIFESSTNRWVFGEAGGVCQVGGRYGHHPGINIDTAGNVGIGTTGPNANTKLDVAGRVLIKTSTGESDLYLGNYSTANYVRFHTNNADTYFDMNCGNVLWRQGSGVRFKHDMTAGTFTSSGDIIAYGSPSDKRLKENVKPIESALDKVSKLQGVTFDWKESDSILNIKEDIGFIAQDVQKVIPELVRENEDGMLSMRHQGIAPILLEAIKELKAEIEELKKCKCDSKR